MKEDTTTPASDGRREGLFDTTRWSLVLAAGQDEHASSATEAMETLCRRYWQPLFVFLRRTGHSRSDAQDLVQGLFTQILMRRDLGAVHRDKGRFRSYLLAALRNFEINQWKREHAGKRGGGFTLSLDDLCEADSPQQLPASGQSPDEIFDQQWAVAMLRRVLNRLRDECVASGRGDQFQALRGFIEAEVQPGSQAEIAASLGISVGAVKQAVLRLRRRYRALLREEIADTVAVAGDVDEEIRHLVAALRR